MDEKRFFKVVLLANLAILVIILLGFLLWLTRGLVSPTLAALLVAYLLFPILNHCNKIGIPRWLGVLAVILALGFVVSFTSSVVIPIITEEVGRYQAESLPEDGGSPSPTEKPEGGSGEIDGSSVVWPALPMPEDKTDPGVLQENSPFTANYSESTLLNIIQQVSVEFKEWGLIQDEWKPDEIRITMNKWVASRGQELIGIVSSKAIQVFNFLLIFTFVLIFGLLEGDRFYKTLVSSLPNSMFEGGIYIINSTTKMFGAYIRGVAIETVILGLICFGLCVPMMFIFQKLTLVVVLFVTLVISVTNVVRIVGPIFGALAGAIVTFSSTSDLKAAVAVLAVAGVVQLFDNALVLPLVMEGQMEIHPVLCMLGVLAGGVLGGVLGMILAIPVIGGVKVLVRVLSVELHKFNYGSKPYYIYQPPTKV